MSRVASATLRADDVIRLLRCVRRLVTLCCYEIATRLLCQLRALMLVIFSVANSFPRIYFAFVDFFARCCLFAAPIMMRMPLRYERIARRYAAIACATPRRLSAHADAAPASFADADDTLYFYGDAAPALMMHRVFRATPPRRYA